MIKTFVSNNTTQISDHFNISEFKCKCGKSHDIKLDSNLIDKLESLYKALNCSKIIINSGYRCHDHDKKVGGNGTGQHTKGTAADIVCYNQNGEIISSKKVCCAAQDIGFNGIANIDSVYTATHVDVRLASLKWFGNEAIGAAGTNNSVTSDFYKYFGLTKKDVYPDDSKSDKIGIDDLIKHKVELTVNGVTYEGTFSIK